MTPRIEMIWEDVCAADFSTPDGIRAFTDRARSEYTAEELVTYLDYTSEYQRHCMTNGHEQQFRVQWEGVADEAKDLIALIRGFGAGGIKSPLIETADGGKVIHPCLHDVCDMTTGKPIDELYDQTVVSLRRMAARAMESNATVQDVAKQEAEHHKENMNAHGETHARLPKKPRADKGGKHTMRKNRTAASVNGQKHTAKWLAGVLNKAKFQPEKGAGWLGACTEGKIEQWDKWCADHPGEKTKRWGYCTELRTDAGRYNDLMDFIANWAGYWMDYKTAFAKWRTIHPNEPREKFNFRRAMLRRTDIGVQRIGKDADGKIFIRPRTDAERKRDTKVAGRAHVKLYNIGCR